MPPATKTHMCGPHGSATEGPLCSLSSASAKRSASSTKNSSLSSTASKLQDALLSVARLLPTKTSTRLSSKSARLSRRSDSRRSSPPNITIIVNNRPASASPPRSPDLSGAPSPAAAHAGALPTRSVAAPPAAQLAANDLNGVFFTNGIRSLHLHLRPLRTCLLQLVLRRTHRRRLRPLWRLSRSTSPQPPPSPRAAAVGTVGSALHCVSIPLRLSPSRRPPLRWDLALGPLMGTVTRAPPGPSLPRRL